MQQPRNLQAAIIEETQDGILVARLMGSEQRLQLRGRATLGSVVRVETFEDGAARVYDVVAEPGSAKARMIRLADRNGMSLSFSKAVMDEVADIEANPGLNDPKLKNLRDVPFVTIDGESSRDLDQAVYVERGPDDGYIVYYAIADASYYIHPGRPALFEEAMKRGVTYYLPGISIPMLPRELSEGIISLNPHQDRRAFVSTFHLDKEGNLIGTHHEEALIRSQAKLSFKGVQDFLDGKEADLANTEFADSLKLIKEVGERRIARSQANEVVRIERREVAAGLSSLDPSAFTLMLRAHLPIEDFNAAISIMHNSAGAKYTSVFSTEAGKHHGVGEEAYGRYSAPMREMVGIYNHCVNKSIIEGAPPAGWETLSPDTQDTIVDIANTSAKRAKGLEKQAHRLVLHYLFQGDLGLDRAERPVRQATVLGLTANRIYLRFDDPPVEIKVWTEDLAKDGIRYQLDPSRVRLNAEDRPSICIGDAVEVVLERYVDKNERYVFSLNAVN